MKSKSHHYHGETCLTMELATCFPGSSGQCSARAQGPLTREAVDRIPEKSGRMDAEFPSEDSVKCALVAV